MKFLQSVWFPAIIFVAVTIAVLHEMAEAPATQKIVTAPVVPAVWQAPVASPGSDPASQMIQYGHELIAHTAKYLGPKGSVAAITNGMNCQNCHVEAGAMPYGNCFSAVAATYPVFKPRSGIKESVEFRINDCLLRSLNGKTID